VTEGDPFERVRQICLALPTATEKTDGRPVFQVRGKSFVMCMDNHHNDGRLAIWCKAPPGAQEILVGTSADRFFIPPYVGPQGWVGVRLDREVDWDELAGLIVDGYRMSASKRDLAALDR
jgi:predicted DNA-binding protein (MmcQ/YjbR family)